MIQSRKSQQGLIMMVVIVAMMMMALTVLVSRTSDYLTKTGGRISAANEGQKKIINALISFTATYQRLPCPANPIGGANPGWPDGVKPLALPASPTSTCAYQAGVIPWNVLGLSQAQVTDDWGRLISYRVYDGQVGLTQDKGATAVNCDTDNQTTIDVPPTINGLCDNTGGKHDTLNTLLSPTFTKYNFPATPPLSTPSYNKGLNVFDFGPTPTTANISNVAFVLISHGPSGLGGYTPSGSRLALPAFDSRDYGNTQPTPSYFIKQAPSNPDTASGTSGHYDDAVSYISIADLLKLAKHEARNWPEQTAAEMPKFDAATTANMTTPSVNPSSPHFQTSGTTGQGFTQADSGNAVQAGAGSGSYSSCLWWPVKLDLVSGSTKSVLVSTVDFASTDNSNDNFPGFTLGYLSGSDAKGPPLNDTCGTTVAAVMTATNTTGSQNLTVSDTSGLVEGMAVDGPGIDPGSVISSITSSTVVRLDNVTVGSVGTVSFADARLIRRDLGWAGGSLAAYTDRFAVEFDPQRDRGNTGPPIVPTALDPDSSQTVPHLAVDYGGVVHDGVDASSCAAFGSGHACDGQKLNFPSVSKTGDGLSGSTTITVSNVSGIAHGMSVSGTGVQSGAKVVSISGNEVLLDRSNISPVSGNITFSSVSTSNFMQNGLSIFHTARVEVYPRDCVAATASGATGSTNIVVSSNAGIEYGMYVYGDGIATGATVVGISGTTVTLSIANTSTVPVDTIVNAGGSSAVTTSATGLSGSTSISVTNPKGISIGMDVIGVGIASGAKVLSFSGSTITLTLANTSNVSGVSGFTTATTLARTLVKSWTLSNAGCNENNLMCAAMKNTGSLFTSDISANRQAMNAVACVPQASVSTAYDSLYFGITTANRDTNGTATANVKFKGLSVQTLSIP